jgi:hypothetical protein
MADGSAGPDGMSSSPSTTDLKGLIKDSLRGLLQDEPALLSRGVTGGVDGESHGGEFAVFATGTVFFLSVMDVGQRAVPPWRPWTAMWRGWTAGPDRRGPGRGVRCGPLLLGARGRPRGGGGRQAGRVGRIGGRGETSLSVCRVRAG